MAQATISNSYFPSAGDTVALAIASYETTRHLTISPSDENHVWNFSALDSVSTNIERYETVPDSIKTEFPDADMIATIDGQQVVFNKTNTRFEILGLKNFHFKDLFFKTNLIPDKPILERRAPLNHITVNNNHSEAIAVVSPNQLPDSLLHQLPIRPDSVRIQLTNTRQDYVDAWGSLRIPNDNMVYPVLRVRCIDITEKKIDVKINETWTDVTPQYFKGNTSPQDTLITYNFWSEGIKTPILRLTVNTDSKVTKAEYRIPPPLYINVSGTVRFWTGQGMANVTVKIGNDSVKTDNNGQYRLNNIEIGKNLPIMVAKEDAYDNGVDAADLLYIRRHIVGISEITSKFPLFAADVDDNNDVDAADLLYIRRLIVGINTQFPNTTAWRFVTIPTSNDARFPFSKIDSFPLMRSFQNDTGNFDFYAVKKGDIDGSADR